jgi:CRISPR/Cas system-associated endonuclease/helicase Cas3
MTFTFDPSLADNTSLVRFHIGDTNAEGGHFLEDETIAYWVNQVGVPHAVIECIKYIITQLSTPDFTQYWLKVSNEKAREGYERLLATKQKEFGIVDQGFRVRSIISHPYRADSYMTDGEQDGAP